MWIPFRDLLRTRFPHMIIAAKDELNSGLEHSAEQLTRWLNRGLESKQAEAGGTPLGGQSGMLAVLTLRQGPGRGAEERRKHSTPGQREDQFTIGAVTPSTSLSRSGPPEPDGQAEIIRDYERWRRAQEPEGRMHQEEPRRTNPITLAGQGGESLIEKEERRSTPASRAHSESRSRRLSGEPEEREGRYRAIRKKGN